MCKPYQWFFGSDRGTPQQTYREWYDSYQIRPIITTHFNLKHLENESRKKGS